MLETGLVTDVDGSDVVVRYADPEHRADQVSVWAHLRLGDTTMARVQGGWEVRLSGLPVDRLEYLLDVDGRLQPDPGNPHVVPGPFGDHSWVALPGYREPPWLALEPVPAARATLTLSRSAVGRLDTEIWAPADAAADEVADFDHQPHQKETTEEHDHALEGPQSAACVVHNDKR